MTDLTALLSRLSEAKEGSRELDAEIAKAVLKWSVWRSHHGYWNIKGPNGETFTSPTDPFGPKYDPDTGKKNPNYDKEPDLWIYETEIPELTADMDAAFTLADPNWIKLHFDLTADNKWKFGGFDKNGLGQVGIGATKPLALCIASLKARGG